VRRRIRRSAAPLLGLLAALAGPGLVTLLAFLEDLNGAVPALLYLLAVAIAAAAGGLLPGLLAALASLIPFDYFFVGPAHVFEPASVEDLVAVVVFVIVAVMVSEVIARSHRAREAAERASTAESAARLAADLAANRARRLQRLTAALAEITSPEDVLEAVLTRGVEAADARAGLIALLREDGHTIDIAASHGYGRSVLSGRETFDLSEPYPVSEALRAGEPLFFETSEARDARFPTMSTPGGPSHALAVLPLEVEGRAIGGMALSFAGHVHFDRERRDMKIALAAQAAQALERTRLHETERAMRERMTFLARASDLLGSSLDYAKTLTRVAELAVPHLADWCAIDMVGPNGEIQRLAVAHQDPAKMEWARELQERYPPTPDAPYGVPNVLRTGEPEFSPTIPDELLVEATAGDEELLAIVRALGLRSSICVPLVARGQTLGALTLVAAESGRIYGQADLELAQEVARRAAMAVDNAGLYAEAEQRGDAARALAYVGDAVLLADREGQLRYWNPTAETLLGLAADALGRQVADAIPGWGTVSSQLQHVPEGEGSRSTTLPLLPGPAERWFSISAVDFADGTVYALRDVTEERGLEQARSDFVSTASHELRTPLAAVFGAARTLRRTDLELSESDRHAFLSMIESESERLSRIVNQILLAGQLDSDEAPVSKGTADAASVIASIFESAAVTAPDSVSFRLDLPEGGLPVACNESQLRQVLVNLVDNAVKYSPDGGEIVATAGAVDGSARVEIADRGLGIPAEERERIFEKFYRLDPALSRGVGGTGLGLYISRELVERMGGRLSVEPRTGGGSTFVVELPLAG
jgi:signal transduction histidine kinase